MYITVTRARNRHETIRLRTKRTVNENAEEWKALLLAKRENREIDGGIIWVQRVGCNVEKLMVCELNPILSWKRNQIRFLTGINKILTIQAWNEVYFDNLSFETSNTKRGRLWRQMFDIRCCV